MSPTRRTGRGLAVFVIAASAIGALCGAAILAAGVDFARTAVVLKRGGVETEAVVTRTYTREAVGRGGGTQHLLAYTFTAAGETVQGEEPVTEEVLAATAVGDRLPVLHAPGEPSRHHLRDEFGTREWLWAPLFGLACGLLILAASGYGLLATLRGVAGRR